MNPRHLPNIISGLRILLVPPIVVLLAQRNFSAALIVFTVAGVSDAVDGYLARTYGWQSSLGGWLDPIADKLMLVSSYIVLGWLQLLPVWLVGAVIARDVVILTGGLVYYLLIEKVEAQPSLISKLNTVVQLLLVTAVMFNHGVMQLPAPWVEALIYVVLTTTILSGAGYVAAWSIRAVQARRGSKHV